MTEMIKSEKNICALAAFCFGAWAFLAFLWVSFCEGVELEELSLLILSKISNKLISLTN
jgi:hypothetical protein